MTQAKTVVVAFSGELREFSITPQSIPLDTSGSSELSQDSVFLTRWAEVQDSPLAVEPQEAVVPSEPLASRLADLSYGYMRTFRL